MAISKLVANARNKRDQRVEASTATAVNDIIDIIEGGGINTGQIYFINQESDFPTQDGVSITLEDCCGYIISTPITTSKYFVCEGGALSSVVTQTVFLTYTGTGYMFRANENRIRLEDVVISCPNARLLDITGNGVQNFDTRANVANVVVTSCTGIATCTNGGLLVMDTCAFTGNFSTNAIDFVGTGAALQSIARISVVGLGAGATAIDMGTGVNQEIEFSDIITIGDATSSAITGLPDSGNLAVGGFMDVSSCDFSVHTNPLVGVKTNDIRLRFRDNSANVPNSRNAGDMYLLGGTTVVPVSVSGTFYEIGVPPEGGISWATEIEDRFVVGADGVITYIGEAPIEAQIIARATVEKAGGGSQELEVRVAKNWTSGEDGIYKSRAITQNPTPTSVPVGALVPLIQNDNIRLIFSNNGNTSNIFVDVSSVEITG